MLDMLSPLTFSGTSSAHMLEEEGVRVLRFLDSFARASKPISCPKSTSKMPLSNLTLPLVLFLVPFLAVLLFNYLLGFEAIGPGLGREQL